ncbi:right-handed parallel beta-helix repeat-containing protein [Bacteroidota bacterium]
MKTSSLLFSFLLIATIISSQSIERNDEAIELNISGLSGSLQNPAFNPDGEFIVFTHFINGYNSEPADLYIYELETEDLTLLFSDGNANVNLPGSSWNTEGNIIFSSSKDPHDEIYQIDENGGTPDQLTDREDLVAYEPSSSPDGLWVVFESHPLDVEDQGVIIKYEIDGNGSYVELTDSADDCRQPNWSPVGDKILYQRLVSDIWDIWVMNIDGINKTNVTANISGDKTDGSFSADGEWIIFSYANEDAGIDIANIYKINIATGDTVRLTNFDGGYDGAPSLSPDCSLLVFESFPGDPDGTDGTNLYILNLEDEAPTGDEFYVSTNGDDNNPGTLDEPWLTIQNGIDQLSAGKILYIMEGTYNEKLFIETSGTEGNNIEITNYNDDEVIISGDGITDSEAIIELYDVSNIEITGLTLANNEMNYAIGILINGNCDNITIKDNTIYNISFSDNENAEVTEETNAQPVIVFGSDDSDPIENLIIDGNEIFNSRTGFSEALAVNGNVDGFEVINNYIHDISNIGIDIIGHEGTCENPTNDQARNGLVKNNTIHDCISDYATSGGIYVDGGKNITIENNISYHNGYGIEIGCENTGKTTSDIIVRNNVLYDNEICGIAIGGFDYPDGSGKVTDCEILNNTFVKNDFSYSGTGEIYFTYVENVTFENNLFYLTNIGIFANAEISQENLQMDYNLFYSESGDFELIWYDEEFDSYDEFIEETGMNSNSIYTDPLLVSSSVSSPDFHLQENSPAINAGNPDFIADSDEKDMDGDDRIKYDRIDIGADESSYEEGGDPIEIIDINTFAGVKLFPNPAVDIIFIVCPDNIKSIEFYNSSGKMALKTMASQNKINVENLDKGIYILKIDTEKDQIIKKILIE